MFSDHYCHVIYPSLLNLRVFIYLPPFIFDIALFELQRHHHGAVTMFGTFHFLVEWSNSKFKDFKNPTVHPKLPILWNLFVNLIYITSYYNITQVSKSKNDLNIENE